MTNLSLKQNIFTIILGLILVIAGLGHLTILKTEFLAVVPSWVPMDAGLVVLLSGVVEVILGLALIFIKKYRAFLGLVSAIFFILVFPGNISQYQNGIDAFTLNSDVARAIRLLFQPVLVAWALWASGAWKRYIRK